MNKLLQKLFPCIICGLLLQGCMGEVDTWQPSPKFPAGRVMGYRPIYADDAELEIKVIEPQPMNVTRKLYLYGDYLFINELNKGVHIINFSNPALPYKTGFIKIYGNIDVAVKNGYMYADQAGSLITIDIRDLSNITVVNIQANQLRDKTLFPEEANGDYFECADPSKGHVIGWQFVELNDPKCFR